MRRVGIAVGVPGGHHAFVGGAVEVASGGFHTCALNADQTVECWGLDDYGQLGIGEHGNGPCLGGRACQSEPYSLYLQGAAHLAAGIDHTCALLSNGNAVCWGSNDLGQLGVGGSTNGPCPGNVACADAPMPLTTLKNVTQIAAGHSAHTCVLLADKTVKCWGTDEVGELGDGNFGLGDYSSIPVAVIGP